jgi:hypothetical protein
MPQGVLTFRGFWIGKVTTNWFGRQGGVILSPLRHGWTVQLEKLALHGADGIPLE